MDDEDVPISFLPLNFFSIYMGLREEKFSLNRKGQQSFHQPLRDQKEDAFKSIVSTLFSPLPPPPLPQHPPSRSPSFFLFAFSLASPPPPLLLPPLTPLSSLSINQTLGDVKLQTMAYRQQQSFDGSTHELHQQSAPYEDQQGYDNGYTEGPSRVRGGAGECLFLCLAVHREV